MKKDSFTLAATGDAIIDRPVGQYEGNMERFDDLLTILRESDAAVTQVEPVLVDDSCRPASLRQVTDQYQYLSPFPGAVMSTDPDMLDELTNMGLNLFTASSNHALDFGRRGVERTIAAMRERELAFAGIGKDLPAARKPAYLDTVAGRIGLINACTNIPPNGEAGVPTSEFDGSPGINPLHVEWTYRVSPEKMEALKKIAEETGLERIKGEWLRRENPVWENEEEYYFMHMGILTETPDDPAGIYQSVHEPDREAILKQIRHTDQSADWVLMTVHSHQAANGDRNTNQTPEFLREFACQCIEAGADAVVGTGPHSIRGIELYQGKPIFYSLGNFFFQTETVSKTPDYLSKGVDETVPDLRGSESSDEDDTESTPDEDHWTTIVPQCEFDKDGELRGVEIYPCTLQPKEAVPRRGVPVLAEGDQAGSILETVTQLSEEMGTSINVEDDVGHITPK